MTSVVRHGEKTRHIGEHKRRGGAGEQQAHIGVERRAEEPRQGLVQGGERHEHPNREHRAGQRVAQRGEARRGAHSAPAPQTHAVRQAQRNRRGEEGGSAGHAGARGHEIHEAPAPKRIAHRQRMARENHRRHREAEEQRQRAAAGGQPSPPARQAPPRRRRAPPNGIAESPAACVVFGQHQNRHHDEQPSRQLRRRGAVAKREPSAEDAGGEGGHAEVIHHAKVRHGLHSRQSHAAGDGRPRRRQPDAPKGSRRPSAERARRFGEGRRLRGERGARQEVDIRIEHQGEHERGAAQRANARKEVVANAPAHRLAERRLHRPGVFEQVGVNIGHHIRRRRQRQHQRPRKHAATGEILGGHRPRRRHADDAGQHAHRQREQQRVGGVVRKHSGAQVPPRFARRREQGPQDRNDGKADHGDGQPSAHAPTPLHRGILPRRALPGALEFAVQT